MDFFRIRRLLAYTVGISLISIVIATGINDWTTPRRPEPPPAPPPAAPAPVPTPVAPLKSPRLDRYQSEPTISLYVHDTGQTIWLKMDDYIAGVIAAEMDPAFPLEALAAQAVTARSITIWSMVNGGTPRQLHKTDACTSMNHLQVYNPKRVNARVRQAVQDTRGLIATYQGEPINAFFSSFAGGQTATLEESFPTSADIGKTPYLSSVPSPASASTPDNIQKWEAAIPLSTLRRIAGSKAGSFTSVTIVARGPSGRATRVQLGNTQLTGAELRSRLGTSVLKSTLIDQIYTNGSKVVFVGRGWGNGVGLDQWGAHAMAEKGSSHEDIIRHYFQGIDILKLWD